jgi:hypothetical protein
MKVLIAIIAPAVLIAGAAFAADDDAELNEALTAAGRKALSVAPWVKLTVSDITVGDKLRWTLKASTGQPYACVADADADALTSGKAVCTRTQMSAEEIAAREAVADARVSAGRANRTEAAMAGQERSRALTQAPGANSPQALSAGVGR